MTEYVLLLTSIYAVEHIAVETHSTDTESYSCPQPMHVPSSAAAPENRTASFARCNPSVLTSAHDEGYACWLPSKVPPWKHMVT